MLILKSTTILILAATTLVWARRFETGVATSGQHICHHQCYDAYRYLIGDVSEDLVLQYRASHQITADTLCASEQCLECEFCDNSLTGRFPILSMQEVELNRMANAETRIRVDDVEATTCADCQQYLDSCERIDGPKLAYQPSRHEDEPPYHLHVNNHQRTLQCELSLCRGGPTHCGVNGDCERRICKDLAARVGLLQPARTLECADCLKSWVRCIHDSCVPPTLDAFADRVLSPNCFDEDNVQCQQHSWQEINAAVAPDQDCIEQCWTTTPTHCHSGSCALPFRVSATPDTTSLSLAPARNQRDTLSHECNAFRDVCLKHCNLVAAHINCDEKCERLHGTSAWHRRRCEKTCEEKTCWSECRDMTCCIGPEQCREGGEAYRCIASLRCEKFRNMVENIAMEYSL